MKTRNQVLEVAALRQFDLVVIGGGIVGAGVAQNAASRGLSVLLLEREDFASGTSSRTTKLIHGGLRYLEQLRLGITRELCQERALLEQLAPHMVRDFSFILPLLKNDSFFAWKANVGLTVYDMLASGIGSSHRHTQISRKELLEYVPALSAKNVTGGLRFHDCITDDSRLVLEVIKSACNLGGLAINYFEGKGFETEGGKITAINCHDRYSGGDFTIRCRACVNAAGVWSDEVASMLSPDWKKRITPAKGTHIIVPPSALETNSALFLPTKDKRYVFVIPWQRALMIGTTDNLHTGSLEHPLPMSDEIDYLLSVINSYSSKPIGKQDIVAAWAGLRPLVGGEAVEKNGSTKAVNTSKLSREHEIVVAPDGMIVVVGGKLTNYRLMADEVVDKALAELPPEISGAAKQSRTHRIMLGGWTDKTDFLTLTASIAAQARKLGIEPATLDHLIASYGTDAQAVIELVENEPGLNSRICPDFPPIMAEVVFCVLNEMAVSLEDLLCRRMRLGVTHQRQCLEAGPKVAMLIQSLLGWDNARTDLELQSLERMLQQHMASFSPPPI
jgi:glycerol-3-phosphate dehydrogenase